MRMPKQRRTSDTHTHQVRTLRAGSRQRYECLVCGKRLRILSGIIVARTAGEADAWLAAERARLLAFAKEHLARARKEFNEQNKEESK